MPVNPRSQDTRCFRLTLLSAVISTINKNSAHQYRRQSLQHHSVHKVLNANLYSKPACSATPRATRSASNHCSIRQSVTSYCCSLVNRSWLQVIASIVWVGFQTLTWMVTLLRTTTVAMLSLAITFIKERERKKYIYFRLSSSMQQIRIWVKHNIAVR